MKTSITSLALIAAMFLGSVLPALAVTYPVVDTGQSLCYDAAGEIAPPLPGEAFFGQDAQHEGRQPSFSLAADNLTVTDLVTGLVWQAAPDTDLDGLLEPGDKISWWDALDQPAILNAAGYGGHDDWRLPSIKELYSLIDFSGIDPSGYTGDTSGLVPFIDTDYFQFIYGDESLGERIIDSQYWSSNEYVSTTMNGDHTVFGVNFADGRIKGYGTSLFGADKTAFVLCVRGNIDYGANQFVDNGDGTITDLATGLMWQQADSAAGLDWQDALAHAQNLVLAGHDDWRLPSAKELQSLVDYTRSPATHGTAAIDPVFSCSTITDEGGGDNFPCYWSSTTHANWTATAGGAGAYVAFGEGLGWMQAPFPPFDYTLMDVHGAGCQRSDPKDGDPADYPYGHGPQGDVIRIFNHVRCVRDVTAASGAGDHTPGPGLNLRAYPNPFNPRTTLSFEMPESGTVSVALYDLQGRRVRSLLAGLADSGHRTLTWDGTDDRGRALPGGIYLARVETSDAVQAAKIVLAK